MLPLNTYLPLILPSSKVLLGEHSRDLTLGSISCGDIAPGGQQWHPTTSPLCVSLCNLCKENEESANYILIHCGPREEKECSLENGAYLSVLVYLGRVKSKNLPRGRDVRYELEETLSSVSS
ncbi:hypothetical protein CK203_034596 [Vitis vinifera]|uniref:Uncharacterized protein n=1 Tax=Vitis vinifera TaxID=29760 RepID=A0A438IDS4_VITVI|nr:hypothetical protein CK203_034596 [Vitis vinifera]